MTNNCLFGKIKSLTRQFKFAEYEIIFLLDEFDKLEKQCIEDVSAAKVDKADTAKMIGESHENELLKESEIIRNICEKNKSDSRAVNSVSHFFICIF